MTTYELVASGLYVVPALVWTIIARNLWEYVAVHRTPSRAIRLTAVTATVLGIHFWIPALFGAVPGATPIDPWEIVRQPAHAVREVSWLVGLAVLRHTTFLSPLPERRASPVWLAVNYGITGLGAAVGLTLRALGDTPAQQETAHRVFETTFVVIGALALFDLFRAVRPGGWGPEHAGEIRRSDVAIIVAGLVAAFLLVPIAFVLGGRGLSVVLYEVAFGLTIAIPFATRMLGVVLVEFVVLASLLAGLGATVGAHVALASHVEPRFYPLLLFVTVLLLGVIAAPGEAWLRETVHRVLFRRSLRAHAEIQEFLGTLSPELGTIPCCERALAELSRVRRLPGAAILLDDGRVVVHGDFDVEPLVRVWPRGAAADRLPARPFGTIELRELPEELRAALSAANVGLGAAPILSPRRRWGHLFMNTGLLRGTFRADDLDAFAGFLAQLALLLDGADLLARAVGVERSLAHAEKLAAIGELAARVAHEIRNPVTAARSLAQQLVREPTSPHNAEHAEIILEELARVERQVRDLLRFARRDELAFAAVDVGTLARDTIDDLRPGLVGLDVSVEVAPGDLVGRADREKLRQVLVNLIENARDALAGAATKRLRIGVGREDGRVVLTVADSGPGIAPDALAQVFEPFFSTKPSGTGLGLAIAKRTIDAHGGDIEATSGPGEGATFRVSLPVAPPAGGQAP